MRRDSHPALASTFTHMIQDNHSESRGSVMSDDFEKSLEEVDEGKRETVRKLLLTAAFVAPAVTTFSVDGKAGIFTYLGNLTAS